MHPRSLRLLATTLVSLLSLAGAIHAQTTSWVGTWAAAPSAVPNEGGTLSDETTLREIVHVSRGGDAVRVTFSNELGTDSLQIEGAQLGARQTGGGEVIGSGRPLLFGGQPGIVIPPGAVAVSDPLDLHVAALSDLAISLALPAQPLRTITAHPLSLQTNYVLSGNQLANPEFRDAKPLPQWRFLKNVEVRSNGAASAVVTFGDSITDGYKSTPDTNQRWPDILARRLQADKRLRGVGVLNEGISGNRVHDNAGPNALSRLDRDVPSQSGVHSLILLEAINDIGRSAQPHIPDDRITAEQIIVGYEQIIARAHAHGIKVYGATLTPFLGAGYATPAGETMRQTVNTWIRAAGHFDGVIDFDQVTRDPANPSMFLPAFDSGDHLHPSDAGYKAMADSLSLALFGR